jgi:hypothetical protein
MIDGVLNRMVGFWLHPVSIVNDTTSLELKA